jgi:hypothetical protein
MSRALLLAAVLLVGGCGSEPSGQEDHVTPSSSNTPAPAPTGPAAAAVADLAQRLSVDAAAITVVSSEEVTWRDGSLGCPKPGMNYTQALVDGSRIVLEHGRTRYEYHSGGTNPPFLCEHPSR